MTLLLKEITKTEKEVSNLFGKYHGIIYNERGEKEFDFSCSGDGKWCSLRGEFTAENYGNNKTFYKKNCGNLKLGFISHWWTSCYWKFIGISITIHL